MLNNTAPSTSQMASPQPNQVIAHASIPRQQTTMLNINNSHNLNAPSIQLALPIPPLSTAQPHPNALIVQQPQRVKKKSKYSKEQDELILSMKKQGKSWVEISEKAKCGNFLAARNRYQVLIGQQGGGAVAWSYEDTIGLQSLLDKGEKEKWKFIATELTKVTSKRFTDVQCREMIKQLFSKDPSAFGVVVSVGPPPPLSQQQGAPQVTSVMPYPHPQYQQQMPIQHHQQHQYQQHQGMKYEDLNNYQRNNHGLPLPTTQTQMQQQQIPPSNVNDDNNYSNMMNVRSNQQQQQIPNSNSPKLNQQQQQQQQQGSQQNSYGNQLLNNDNNKK